MRLVARVEGVGLIGPGMQNWIASREMLAGREAFAPRATVMPVPEALPPTERRRAGKSVRVTLAAGLEAAAAAGREPRDLAAVFASSSGDGENCHAICEALTSDDRLISPTRFHNSVHNAPAGYWGIATGSMHSADCVAAFDGSFAAGLLEAAARLAGDPSRAVLLVAYDAPYPEPLAAKRPIDDAFAVAFALTAPQAAGRGPRIAIDLAPHEPATVLDDASLESLRRSIPAARALPLLSVLARGASGRACVEYLHGLALRVEIAQ